MQLKQTLSRNVEHMDQRIADHTAKRALDVLQPKGRGYYERSEYDPVCSSRPRRSLRQKKYGASTYGYQEPMRQFTPDQPLGFAHPNRNAARASEPKRFVGASAMQQVFFAGPSNGFISMDEILNQPRPYWEDEKMMEWESPVRINLNHAHGPQQQAFEPPMSMSPAPVYEQPQPQQPKAFEPLSPPYRPLQIVNQSLWQPELPLPEKEEYHDLLQDAALTQEDNKMRSNAWGQIETEAPKTAAPKHNKTTRNLNIITSVFIVCLLAMALVVFALPRVFGIELYTVLSDTMHPDFSAGSVVVVRPQVFESIEVGDDISFVMRDNIVATHRVAGRDPNARTFATQSAVDGEPNTLVHYENVIGAVWFGIPLLGYAINWLEPTVHKVIAVIVVGALWLVLFLLGRALAKPKNEPEIA